MATLSNLPAWTVNYRYNIAPNTVRTDVKGPRVQGQKGHRLVFMADVTRRLRRAELPYFEYFVREVLNDGADKYTDSYQDQSGLQTGTVRIVNGAYKVAGDRLNWVVTARIEVFR